MLISLRMNQILKIVVLFIKIKDYQAYEQK